MRTRLPSALLTAAFASSLTAAVATAAPRDRVFVASYGTDSGNTICSFTQPCRTFANAVANVAVGGEVSAIDSAGFGPVTITQSVTITSPNGVEAGIVNPGGNAVTINPTTAAAVTLRGLTLEGSGTGQNGIVYSPTGGGFGAVLNIIGCVVKDFTNDGIMLTPSFASGDRTFVFIDDSAILNNATNGIEINPQANTEIEFTIKHASVDGNGRISGNGVGILVNTSSTNSLNAGIILSSTVTGNGIGLKTAGAGNANMALRLRKSVFIRSENFDVVSNSGGNLYLFSNEIDSFDNVLASFIFSDGTNDISGLPSGSITPISRE